MLLMCCACFAVLYFTGSQLGLIETSSSKLTPLATGFTSFGRLAVTGPGLSDHQGEITVVTVAGSATKSSAVVMLKVCLECISCIKQVRDATVMMKGSCKVRTGVHVVVNGFQTSNSSTCVLAC